MMEERYIAAIEISSSKIIGTVGRTNGDGALEVLALEQERAVEVVRHGVIQNLEDASMRINTIIDRLEHRNSVMPRKITGVFVGLSGRSVRSIPVEASLHLEEGTEITEEIVERLRKQALSSAIDSSLEVIDAVPRTFRIGKRETTSPKGNVGDSISATFDLIVCRPELKRNITRVLPDKLNIRIEGFVVTALATGQLIPTNEEKRLGCMLVDMGAETTTVTIYKNGSLRYFATLPLGGRNITRDVESLGIVEERAEDIKITSGNAVMQESASTININGVKLSEVANLIVARSEEIVANIVEQIAYAGFKESDLPGGIICIGGGIYLNGMTDLLEAQSSLPVRRGHLPDYIQVSDTKAKSMMMTEVVSVLYAGATLTDHVCLEMPESKGLPATGEAPDDEIEEDERKESRRKKEGRERTFRLVEKFKKFTSGMFVGGPDDSDPID